MRRAAFLHARVCFDCELQGNPYLGINLSCTVAGEPSSDPRRRVDGTSEFNMGLPGVDTVIGTRADGKPKLAYRPISHNELATDRKRKEYAKRKGLIPMETPKRAIGGR